MPQAVNLPPLLEPAFELGLAERRSPTWVAIEEHYTLRLAELRRMNDSQKDLVDTAFIRGQIAMVKELLKLGQDRPGARQGI